MTTATPTSTTSAPRNVRGRPHPGPAWRRPGLPGRRPGLPGRRLAIVALILAAGFAPRAIHTVAAQNGLFVVQPEGEPIPVEPGSDCVVTVAGWENESWVSHDAVTGRDSLVVGKPTTSSDAESDVKDVRRWLAMMLKDSEDMRRKTKGACEALGVKHIAIRVVRNDRKLVAGRWWRGTNLFMLDLGDIEVLGKHIEPVGEANASLVDSATLRLGSLLLASTIPHEMDHMRRAREQKPRGELEQLAVDDENQVASEIGIRNYSRDGYGDGKYLNYTVGRIKLRVDLSAAGAEVLKAAQDDPHYFELDDHDDEALRNVTDPANASAATSQTASQNAAGRGATSRAEQNIGSIGSASGRGTGATPPAGATGAGRPAMTGGSRATSDIGSVGNTSSGALRADARHVLMPSGDDDWVRDMRMQIAMQAAARFRLPEPDVTDAAEPGTKVVDGTQKMGASVIGYADNQAVITQRFDRTPARPAVPALAVARPAVPALAVTRPRPSLWTAPPAQAPDSQDAGAPAVVQVLFTSLGKSSGDAMTMTVMTTSAEPVQFLGEGFVLEPVSGLSASDAARRLAGTGGRRATVTLAAYCLDLPKAPPRAGQIFRIAPQAVQRAHASFGRLMQASRQVRDRLRPDSDPDEYFHAIRQWAVWTTEEGFRDEAAFTRAFLDHAKKNLEGTGRRLTRDLEDAIRALLPNRWHDVQQVLDAARR